MKRYLTAILTAVLLLSGCASSPAPGGSSEPPPSPPPEDQTVFAPVELPDMESEPESDPRQEAIEKRMASMTDEELVGQLVFARCPTGDAAALAAEYHLGGYLLFGRDFKNKSAQEIQASIAAYQEAASVPMLIGVDEEGGTVVRVSSNPQLREKRFSSPQTLYKQGGLDAIAADCQEKDALLASLGINVNFAPVADLSTDPKDFIYDRTLGKGVEETSEYIATVVGQMGTDKTGSVLKHFPGYGSNKDTHTGSALDERPMETFRTSDFLPFQAGMEASDGTAAVLVSHNIVTCMDPNRPASLSPAVYQILREELSFEGVALTDDLAMDAITVHTRVSESSPAVDAIAAGCDMIVTTDFQGHISALLNALENGYLPRERVEEAAFRVLGWKYDLGLIA